MQQKYADRGFQVLAFPCNQFGGQEPGTPSEIEKFAADRCPSGLKLFQKVDVNGFNTFPIFAWLKEEQNRFPLNDITWNFEKFLLDRKGKPVARYLPPQSPKSFEDDIVKLLDQ